MTFSAPIASPIRSSPTGYPIDPVATIVPCPIISRGTLATVPSPPGLVREMLPPVKSSAVSVLVRALSTSSLYASRNSGKLLRPASRITGTISVRVPSLRSTSTASPRLTAPSSIRCGLPSASAKWWAICGISSVATRAIAYAIRCVNETRCPASFSCARRAASSVTVVVRKDVAVGTLRLSSM